MGKRVEREGTVQGRLSVIRLHDEKHRGSLVYVCTCSCNPSKEILKTSGSLSGGTKSCGCLYKENARKQLGKIRHMSVTHNLSKSPTYTAWRNMKARCDDPKHQAYKNYKERGISYDDSWKIFENFLSDMGERPKDLTLNRIDVNKGYCKDNCEWADNYKQARDRRKPTTARSSKYKGVSFNKKEGKYKGTLGYRGSYIHLGYSESEEFLACCYDKKVLELTKSVSGTNLQLGLLEIDVFEKYLEDNDIIDVVSLQELFEVMAPWSTRLPQFDVFKEEIDLDEWGEDGYYYSNLGKYKQYRHKITGQYRRGRTNLLTKEQRNKLLGNIV